MSHREIQHQKIESYGEEDIYFSQRFNFQLVLVMNSLDKSNNVS